MRQGAAKGFVIRQTRHIRTRPAELQDPCKICVDFTIPPAYPDGPEPFRQEDQGRHGAAGSSERQADVR